jgi:hypothetical protein
VKEPTFKDFSNLSRDECFTLAVWIFLKFADLAQALDEANRTYHGDTEDKQKQEDRGKRQALWAVLQFLQETTRFELWTPLYHLFSDLEDLKGKSMPMFHAFNNALCVVAVDVLVEHGERLEQALRKVSKATGGKFSMSYLRDQRKNLHSQNRRNARARLMYNIMRPAWFSLVQLPPSGVLDTVSERFQGKK